MAKVSPSRWWTCVHVDRPSEYLHMISASSGDHGGIQVGAITLPSFKMKELMQLLREYVGKNNNRVINKRTDGSLIIHLLPECVEFIENEIEGKMKIFFEDDKCTFHSGVRPMDLTNFSFQKVQKSTMERFTFAEIFAGIGGFRLGMEKLGGVCVLTSELDRNAVSTYEANWPNSQVIGNILTL